MGRVYHSIRMLLCNSSAQRADYIREHNLFKHVGENCTFMFRKIPLYGQLIYVGNNVRFASNVTLVTHDAIHLMLSRSLGRKTNERVGCIYIDDNVFIGANSTILYDTYITNDVIIGANSLVNKSIEKSGVYAGVPVKYLCSIEEFVEKRKNNTGINKSSKIGSITHKELEECWFLFNKKIEEK